MQFVDEATVEVVAGAGGKGVISFRRESHVAFGGPDGGNGGRGGDVVVFATSRVVTLLDHRYKRWYKGKAGDNGGAKNCTGRSADPIRVPVPIGTVLTDETTGDVIADLSTDGQEVVVARGGRGGQGNARFQTSTRQTPRFAQDGEAGESRTIGLSLKLVADVGLLGLPNAGKSTFLRAVTESQARVGAYPFTTLVPNLGVYRRGDRDLVIADIPGLIEGAHEGQGLGDRFLKHVERTRVLIHLLSLSPDAPDATEAWRVVNNELAQRSAELRSRPQLVVLNKIDVLDDRYELDLWREAFAELGVEVLVMSGLTGENVHEIMTQVLELIPAKLGEEEDDTPKPWSPV